MSSNNLVEPSYQCHCGELINFSFGPCHAGKCSCGGFILAVNHTCEICEKSFDDRKDGKDKKES